MDISRRFGDADVTKVPFTHTYIPICMHMDTDIEVDVGIDRDRYK